MSKWYKLGKIKSGSQPNQIIGQDTNWEFAGISAGDIFLIENYPPLEIISIEDNTHLTLDEEVSISNWQNYKIAPFYSATMQSRVCAELAELLRRVRKAFDEKTNTLKGENAFELAQDNGFRGTLDEWLESLKGGPKGDPGTNGKSAFELAKDAGFAGNVSAWLESLKGSEGKSSYDLACEKGFAGTVDQYLDSLHGANGKDGADGENGLSSYEIAVANGFIGSQLAWLESLRADCRFCSHYHHGYFHHVPPCPAEGEETPSDSKSGSAGSITNNIYVNDEISGKTLNGIDGGDLDGENPDATEGVDLDG